MPEINRLLILSIPYDADYETTIKDFTRRYLRAMLLRNRGRMGDTATALGIHRNSLTRLCQSTGVVIKECRPPRKRPVSHA